MRDTISAVNTLLRPAPSRYIFLIDSAGKISVRWLLIYNQCEGWMTSWTWGGHPQPNLMNSFYEWNCWHIEVTPRRIPGSPENNFLGLRSVDISFVQKRPVNYVPEFRFDRAIRFFEELSESCTSSAYFTKRLISDNVLNFRARSINKYGPRPEPWTILLVMKRNADMMSPNLTAWNALSKNPQSNWK